MKKYYFYLLGLFLLAMAYRYLCHSLMLFPAIFNEFIPAPKLPDIILDNVTYNRSFASNNYYLWIAAYMPLSIYLFIKCPNNFFRFVLLGGVVSLVRGFTIPLTTFGPPIGEDLNPYIDADPMELWWAVVNPFSALLENKANIYLTKDMFFSGHISSTFLLYLYSRKLGKVSYLFLAANLFTFYVVAVSHLHYTVDIIGAYFITYALFKLLAEKMENRVSFSFIENHYTFPLRFGK